MVVHDRLDEDKSSELGKDFYSFSEEERIAATRSAIASRTSLIDRWRRLGQAMTDKEGDAAWSERSVAAARYLTSASAVTDFGCGTMPLERALGAQQRYVPVDICRRDERTVVCDFNVDPLPATATDGAACLGLLEYLHEPLDFLKFVSEHHYVIVVSYCTTDSPEPLEPRQGHGWVNSFNRSEVEDMFRDADLKILSCEQVDKHQCMWVLTGRGARKYGLVRRLFRKVIPRLQ